MSLLRFVVGAVALASALAPLPLAAQSATPFTLPIALQRALAANPRLIGAEREVGAAGGRQLQAGAIPNPELSAEVDNAFGSGTYRRLKSAELTLQISQLIELGGKRDARIAAATAGLDLAMWQRAAMRLEIASETAVAFVAILVAQRRIQLDDAQIASLGKLAPLLQRRVEVGASSPAETMRAQLAGDLVRAEREEARTALAIARREMATLLATHAPDFAYAVGDLSRIGRAPSFDSIVRGLDANPQIVRYTAIRAQRDAELLSARLKPIPDVRVDAALRHFRDTGDTAARLGVSVPIPVWDRNQGAIIEAQQNAAKTEAELAAGRGALLLTIGRAYETMAGAAREIAILRSAALPNARKVLEIIEAGYAEGRFSLLEVLDAQTALAQAQRRELDVLTRFHNAVATIEGLTAVPLSIGGQAR